MLTHSVFNPLSPQGLAISNLFITTLVIAFVIILGITGVLMYTMIRYRHRPGDGEPPQTYGKTWMEITWTAVPFFLLVGIFGATISTMRLAAPGDPVNGRGGTPPDLTIIGHQWWWELRYADGVVSANEIHLPVGRRFFVSLKSMDVIHDLWVPQLGPKMDLVPGQTNNIWLQSDRAGTFEGACSEFCGGPHAWMLIRVIVQPSAQFKAWERHQLQQAQQTTTSEEALGATLFRQMSCVACHAIYGTTTTPAADLQAPVIAPNLTHVGSRQTLASGRLINTSANMAAWLADPQKWKPGVHMPNVHLNPRALRAMTAYLESLK